jgi:hypothetical protein
MDKNKNNEKKDNKQNIEEKKQEKQKGSWLKIENPDGKVDYSLIDYSKYFKLANPIHDSLLINNKVPLIKEFRQKYSSSEIIPEDINIKKLAKKYFDNLPLIEKYTGETIITLKPKIKNLSITFFLNELYDNKYLKVIDGSLTDLMGDKFMNLYQRVRLHINLFCYMLTQFEKEMLTKYLVDYNINILYWVTLYHDIGKHQKLHKIYEKDYVYGVLDKMHPFKSILIFIEALLEKKLFKISDDELIVLNKKYIEFKDVIFDSYEALPETPDLMKTGNPVIDDQKIYNISLKHFDEISSFLKYIKSLGNKNEWIYDAAVLILFHQNIPNNENNMNFPLLSDEQIKDLFDLRLLEMMRIIMYLDSITYSIFDNTEWEIQINKQLDILRGLFA